MVNWRYGSLVLILTSLTGLLDGRPVVEFDAPPSTPILQIDIDFDRPPDGSYATSGYTETDFANAMFSTVIATLEEQGFEGGLVPVPLDHIPDPNYPVLELWVENWIVGERGSGICIVRAYLEEPSGNLTRMGYFSYRILFPVFPGWEYAQPDGFIQFSFLDHHYYMAYRVTRSIWSEIRKRGLLAEYVSDSAPSAEAADNSTLRIPNSFFYGRAEHRADVP
jgi:hypothetical protein